MQFMYWIIERLNDVSGFFYSLYLDVSGWGPLFWLAAVIFYQLHIVFAELAWRFMDFSAWVSDVAGKVSQILSPDAIYSYFRYWFDAAINAWDWVVNAFQTIWQTVDIWWSSTWLTVQGYIDAAISGAQALVGQLESWLAVLQSAWDGFKGMIPTIDEVISWWGNWTGNVLAFVNTWWEGTIKSVQDLITTALKEAEPLWSGWQEIREQVFEFFANPVQWLWTRFTDWFLGPEE